jgi:hypothetical protein
VAATVDGAAVVVVAPPVVGDEPDVVLMLVVGAVDGGVVGANEVGTLVGDAVVLLTVTNTTRCVVDTTASELLRALATTVTFDVSTKVAVMLSSAAVGTCHDPLDAGAITTPSANNWVDGAAVTTISKLSGDVADAKI